MSLYSFTKLFSTITDSSIWSEDSDTKVVWVTMLAMADPKGYVAAAIPGLAKRSGVSIESTQKALTKFESPDPYSRSKEDEGRRIKTVAGGWQLLNYLKYREIQSDEDRKDYQREYMREYRKQSVNNCKQMLGPLGQEEEEVEEEVDKKKKEGGKPRFTVPSIEEVEQYATSIGFPLDAPHFVDYYTARGWKLKGGASMKDWKAAIRTWQRTQSIQVDLNKIKKEIRPSYEDHQRMLGGNP